MLVTGAGSGVGQGIIKALRVSGLPVTIVSADITPMNAALYRTDEALILPRVESVGALDGIIKLIVEHNIHVIMIGSEFDLEFFSKNQKLIQDKSGVRVIVSPPETIEIANDKWLTADFLRKRGLPHVESKLADTLEEAVQLGAAWGFPLVVKTRSGTSSRHVHIVKNLRELVEVWPLTPAPLLQKLVDMPSPELRTEYTSSVFKTASRMLGPFHARRTLRGGTSWHIEVKRFPELDDLLLSIGKSLEFEGSLNVQLMQGVSGPLPFEINARFSGTTAVRAHFGFNEPAMALQSYYFGIEPEVPIIRTGIAMRYHEEVFIENTSAEDLQPNISKGFVRAWF